MNLALILATSLFLLSVGSHLVILNAGHTLLEQNCSLLHCPSSKHLAQLAA